MATKNVQVTETGKHVAFQWKQLGFDKDAIVRYVKSVEKRLRTQIMGGKSAKKVRQSFYSSTATWLRKNLGTGKCIRWPQCFYDWLHELTEGKISGHQVPSYAGAYDITMKELGDALLTPKKRSADK